MRDGIAIIRQRQCAIRREMDRRGIALKQVSFDSHIPYDTLLSYFPLEGSREPAVMPVSALYKMAEGKALPNDLLSLLLPTGQMIVMVPENINLDDIAAWAEGFSARKLAAHRKDSECEEQIGPSEQAELTGIVVAFPGSVAA